MDSAKAAAGKAAWEQMEKDGVIERVKAGTNTEWSSALHLQPKASGGYRPCGDFRGVNARSEADDYPLPNLRHFSHNLRGAAVFSKVDLVKAFHQIPIAKEDQMKTAVKTPWGVLTMY